MNTNERGKQLHDQATRNKPLSSEEQQELLAWYAEQDRAESEILRFPVQDTAISSLTVQLETAARQLTALTQRIQEISLENERLKQENAALRHQIVSHHARRRAAVIS